MIDFFNNVRFTITNVLKEVEGYSTIEPQITPEFKCSKCGQWLDKEYIYSVAIPNKLGNAQPHLATFICIKCSHKT